MSFPRARQNLAESNPCDFSFCKTTALSQFQFCDLRNELKKTFLIVFWNLLPAFALITPVKTLKPPYTPDLSSPFLHTNPANNIFSHLQLSELPECTCCFPDNLTSVIRRRAILVRLVSKF